MHGDASNWDSCEHANRAQVSMGRSLDPPSGACVAPGPIGLPIEAEALKTLRSLPPFSAVAIHLFKLVSQEDVAFRKLSDIIRADARISKDMLQVANSPLFGTRSPVTGVLHAVAMLGLERVRSLVTTVALKDFLGPARRLPAVLRCWRHNLACALLCEEITRELKADKDLAYSAGLLHDIGRLAMLRAWLQKYTAMLDASPPDAKLVLEREHEEFGIRHTRAGLILLNEWKLPAVFSEVASRHHSAPVEGQADITALVQFCCSLANRIGFSAEGQPAADQSQDPQAQSPFYALIGDNLLEIRHRVEERINELECCLET